MFIAGRAGLFALCAMLALPSVDSALADPAIKPALTGLIATAGGSQGNENNTVAPLTPFEGVFGGYVARFTWAALEPEAPQNGVVTINTALIDTVLREVTRYNNKVKEDIQKGTLTPPNDRLLGVRLRVWAGCNDAPEWATKLDGGRAITTYAYYSGNYETCESGKFWDTTSNYAAAWRQFQTALAAYLDGNSLVNEVAVTSCTSYSAEPFFLPWNNGKPTTKEPLLDDVQIPLLVAGYTGPKYRDCLEKAVDDYADWHTTRLEFTFLGFSGLTENSDIAFSERVMRRCRLTAGLRCILSGHDVDAETPGSVLPIYALEHKFGPPITYQSLHSAPVDYEGTIRKAVSLGASSIEIWAENSTAKSVTFEGLPKATLANWASMFEPQ
jgi:hypothetical protein